MLWPVVRGDGWLLEGTVPIFECRTIQCKCRATDCEFTGIHWLCRHTLLLSVWKSASMRLKEALSASNSSVDTMLLRCLHSNCYTVVAACKRCLQQHCMSENGFGGRRGGWRGGIRVGAIGRDEGGVRCLSFIMKPGRALKCHLNMDRHGL